MHSHHNKQNSLPHHLGDRGRLRGLTLAAIAVAVALAPPQVVAATGSGVYAYTAQKGDSLIRIANRYLINPAEWQSLQVLNSLANPNAIGVGKTVLIPTSKMRTEPAPAKVMSVQGTVQANGSALAAGATLKEGDKITTGDGGFVTVKLADGSTLTVQSLSAVRLENARQLANTGGVTDSVVRLDSGRLETDVAKQRHAASRYEIRTPTSNMGVRGTKFRVGADESGTKAQSEVVEGRVAVTAAAPGAGGSEMALNGGFGTIAELGKAPLPPIELLPQPSLANAPARVATSAVAFNFAPVEKAAKYRAQIARDKDFKEVVVSRVANDPSVTFDGVTAGAYYLSVRAIDNLGLEGKDAVHPFRVKSFPVAPALGDKAVGTNLGTRPGNASMLTSPAVGFAWPAAPDAKTYHLQVARDAGFANKVIEERGLEAPVLPKLATLTPGTYYWRVASIDADGDASKFSTVSSFTVSSPAVQLQKTQVSGSSAAFSWTGEASAKYQLQVATDENFRNVVAVKEVTGTQIKLSDLARGFYFARVRVVGEAAGPWSQRQSVEIY